MLGTSIKEQEEVRQRGRERRVCYPASRLCGQLETWVTVQTTHPTALTAKGQGLGYLSALSGQRV